MSSAGMVWARKQDCESLTPKAILLLLGELADDTGRVLRGQQYVANTLHVSRETVGRNYAKLEAMGLITRERQFSPNGTRKIDVLKLNLPCDAESHGADEPCDASAHSHVIEDHNKEINKKLKQEPIAHPPAEQVALFDSEPISELPPELQKPAEAFEEFWKLWPRKVGRGRCEKIWLRSVKAAGSTEKIIEGAKKYRAMYDADTRKPSFKLQYVPHPKTWLNDERWEDVLLPLAPIMNPIPTTAAKPVGVVEHKEHPGKLLTPEEYREALRRWPNKWDDVTPDHARQILSERELRERRARAGVE